jgi:hypothetical protein
MNHYAGAVERNGLYSDTDDLLMLKLLKHTAQNTALCPAVHAGLEGMPVAKAFGQAAPLAAMLGFGDSHH